MREADQLGALLLSADDDLVAQGEELVTSMVGDDPLARARIYVAAGDLIRAVPALRAAGCALPAASLRLLACDLAERAVELVASDVVPKPGQPRRDPRCDEVIAAVRAVAREDRPPEALDALLPVVLAADEHGWWETEAVYALLSHDPLSAVDNAARSMWILVRNVKRPIAEAAPQAVRDGLLALLPVPPA